MHENYRLVKTVNQNNEVTEKSWYDASGVLRVQWSKLSCGREQEIGFDEQDREHGVALYDYHDDQKTREEIPYKHGQIDGVYCISENMCLIEEIPYRADKKHGTGYKYHPSEPGVQPEVACEILYENDMQKRTIRRYENGQILEQKDFVGKSFTLLGYHMTGEKGLSGYYDFDQNTLMIEEFYKSGNKKSMITVAGKECIAENLRYQSSTYVMYYENGRIKEQKLEKDGLYTKYDPDGKIMPSFHEGCEDGLVIEYHGNGSVDTMIEYQHGYKHGKALAFRDDGTKISEARHLLDRPHGDTLMFDQNENLVEKVSFHQGKTHGQYAKYKDGALENSAYYWHDKPISRLGYMVKNNNIGGLIKVGLKAFFKKNKHDLTDPAVMQHPAPVEIKPEALRL